MELLAYLLFGAVSFVRWFLLSWAWADGNEKGLETAYVTLTVLTFGAMVYLIPYYFRRRVFKEKLTPAQKVIYYLFPTGSFILGFLYNADFTRPHETLISVVIPYILILGFDRLKKKIFGVQ